MPKSTDPDYGFATKAIRTGHTRTNEREHSEAIFMTSSFAFESAEQAAAVFAGDEKGNLYSRFSNPTINTLEQRIAALEGGERGVATASGMGAILATAMAVLKSGDHVVVSRNIFGTAVVFFDKLVRNWNVEVTFVDLTDMSAWEQAIQKNTKMFFLETPSNPLTQIADIKALADLAHANDSVLVVDNMFCTPVLQQPLALGADLVLHSATKYLDGQGRAIAGLVVGNGELIEAVFGIVRTAGPAISPFNAWIILKGLETLKIRVEAHVKNAMALATWLENQAGVKQVYYPGLESHPQYALAQQQQKGAGAILSFVLEGGKEAAWSLMDAAKMACISANIGDTKTILTHPASTTHGRLTDEQKAKAGIDEGLVRVSVGLEDIEDIKQDLLLGL